MASAFSLADPVAKPVVSGNNGQTVVAEPQSHQHAGHGRSDCAIVFLLKLLHMSIEINCSSIMMYSEIKSRYLEWCMTAILK